MDLQTLPLDLARNRVISTADAAEYIGVDIQLFRKMIKTGAVPAPIQLSERVRGWRLGELSDWVAARAAERA
jgi:predicted DNA-binding transcriptional regulator AlpA